MLKAIVFDYGKVLTLPPTPEDWSRLALCFDASVEYLQKPYWRWRDMYDRAQLNAESYWTAVAHDLGRKLTREGIQHLTQLDNTQWMNINPEMLEFAWRAQDAGLKIAVLSNMQLDMLAAMRRNFAWLARFDAQIYTCEIGAVKPEPEAYNAALKGVGTSAEDSLFLDDKQVNIDGARAVGMQAQLFEGDILSAYEAVDRLGKPLAVRETAE
ncbi:MAG TPA: HAD family phosphatase [Candidatus Koribacter sp.]|jgi:putative hydrolase of the HAD superfamily